MRRWTSILTALGVGAAVYGLNKYQNGQLMKPVKNFMQKMNPGNMQNMRLNPLMEISEELAPKNLGNTNNNMNNR